MQLPFRNPSIQAELRTSQHCKVVWPAVQRTAQCLSKRLLETAVVSACRLAGQGEQMIEPALRMAVGDGFLGGLEIGAGLDAIDFVGFD